MNIADWRNSQTIRDVSSLDSDEKEMYMIRDTHSHILTYEDEDGSMIFLHQCIDGSYELHIEDVHNGDLPELEVMAYAWGIREEIISGFL